MGSIEADPVCLEGALRRVEGERCAGVADESELVPGSEQLLFCVLFSWLRIRRAILFWFLPKVRQTIDVADCIGRLA